MAVSTMSHHMMISQGWPALSHSLSSPLLTRSSISAHTHAHHASPWNAGILLDVPNAYPHPPGLTHGAWRASAPSATPRPSSPARRAQQMQQQQVTTSLDAGNSLTISTGKRQRPPMVRSTRRAPPPPTPSYSAPSSPRLGPLRTRLQPVPPAFPEEPSPFADRHAAPAGDENSLLLLAPAPASVTHPTTPTAPRRSPRITSYTQSPAPGGGFTYALHTAPSAPAAAPRAALAASPSARAAEYALARQRQRALADKEARLKVIASILLNRVNVVGKPMRRRPSFERERAYVRSGLGRCVAVGE